MAAVLVTPLLVALGLDWADIVVRLIRGWPVIDESGSFLGPIVFNTFVQTVVYAPLCYALALLFAIPSLRALHRTRWLRFWHALAIGVVLGALVAPVAFHFMFAVLVYVQQGEFIMWSILPDYTHPEVAWRSVGQGFAGAIAMAGLWFIGGIRAPSVQDLELSAERIVPPRISE